MFSEVLDGQKVFLRPIQMEDTPLIVKWRNNKNVRNNFVFQETFTNEMHENWMRTKVATGDVVQYIIVVKEENLPIGSIFFRDIDLKNHSAEYGIFIGEDSARGNGYGTEAAKIFVDFGLSKLNLHRIMLRVFADNLQAIQSYHNAGFQKEGIARDMVYQSGQYRDMVFMSIIAGERNI